MKAIAITSPLTLTSMLSSILYLALYLLTRSVMDCNWPALCSLVKVPMDTTAASNADLPLEPKACRVSVSFCGEGTSLYWTLRPPRVQDSISLAMWVSAGKVLPTMLICPGLASDRLSQRAIETPGKVASRTAVANRDRRRVREVMTFSKKAGGLIGV